MWSQARLRTLKQQATEQDARINEHDANLATLHDKARSLFSERERASDACRRLADDSKRLRTALRRAAPQTSLPPAPPEPPDLSTDLPPLTLPSWPAAIPEVPALSAGVPTLVLGPGPPPSPSIGPSAAPPPAPPRGGGAGLDALAMLSDVAFARSPSSGSKGIQGFDSMPPATAVPSNELRVAA